MLRDANEPVRRLWRPIRSGTLPEATIVGSLVQKLANVSVSNSMSTLGTFCIASAARPVQNWTSSSVPVQKNQRSDAFWPLAAAGACWGAVVAAGWGADVAAAAGFGGGGGAPAGACGWVV